MNRALKVWASAPPMSKVYVDPVVVNLYGTNGVAVYIEPWHPAVRVDIPGLRKLEPGIYVATQAHADAIAMVEAS